ncbi:MAG TPA: glycerate kinase [Galbitalea sp.]
MSLVVVAPDSFKGTASAATAAAAIARGWVSVRPHDEIILLPMADGGEGTLAAFAAAVPGAIAVPVNVTGPDGRSVSSEWLLLPDDTGVVELASTSGLTLMDELAVFDANSVGFGQAIVAALDAGVRRLVLGIGGSASTDGGAGVLSALGARLLDANDALVPPGNRGLGALAGVDLGALRAMPAEGAIVLTDVRNPLLGADGAAAVFGEQKGATPGDIPALEANLARLASLLGGNAMAPGTGAAGGVGFGLHTWGAVLRPGAEAVGELLGLPIAIAAASLVITGEGRFDAQSAGGKVPAWVNAQAAAVGTATALVAGSIATDPSSFSTGSFNYALSLGKLAGDVDAAIADPVRWLEAAGVALALDVTAENAL